MLSWRQVGRPWLHWSDRSVTSIWRSRAFISSSVRRRLARTAPWQAMVPRISLRARCTTVLASWAASSASTLRASSTGSPKPDAVAKVVGTARTARVLGEKGVTSRPSMASTSVDASAVATSSAVAAKVAGISSGWLVMRSAASTWVLSRS